MPQLQIEQRTDLFEINTDLTLMNYYRKAILAQLPRLWVLIHYNPKTKNYGLEVVNSWGATCSIEESADIRHIITQCRVKQSIDNTPVEKKTTKRKKKIIKEEVAI
jgi:hypothetical protein